MALFVSQMLCRLGDAVSSAIGDSHINNSLRAKPITKFTDGGARTLHGAGVRLTQAATADSAGPANVSKPTGAAKAV